MSFRAWTAPGVRLAFPLLLAGLAACSEPPPLYVDGAYVRLNANPQAPAAAYFTIHGGAEPVVLRGVTTDEAVRVEMHESTTEGGMAMMKALDQVNVPAKATVKFEPGGKHVMLWSVNKAALADGKMSFTFLFSNGDRILVDAVVQAPPASAAAEPANMADHEHMDH
jgi:copper(I)-binding protein